ncbi:MAG: BatA domain-containing protein [Planctomycetota bacterium]|nr:BatA domain-containing protein [Planctomycetota bacterium]
MTFVHTALLWGTLLFGVPLIIHLLNRQRYKRRPWAAMEFLIIAYKKQRRRLRAENLLLLLLRCLIPIILALAIARPLLQNVTGLPTGSTAHHILVVDQSYSMGYQPEGARSPFERARTLCEETLTRLDGGGSHKVSIWSAGIRPTKLLQEEMNLGRAKTIIANLKGPEDSAADLTTSLTQIAEQIEEKPEPDVRVYVFTDLQERSFGSNPFDDQEEGAEVSEPEAPTAEMFKDSARDSLQRIAKHAQLTILDVASRKDDSSGNDNAQISDLRLGRSHAVRRVPIPAIVTVRNLSDTVKVIQVALDVEEGGTLREQITVEPGSEGQAEFFITFRETGPRWVTARIDDDPLSADNQRFLVADVRERLRLLLVEGSAETEASLMESEQLRALLDPTRGEGEPELTSFSPKVVDTVEFLSGRENPQDYDLIALCNVSRLNEATANAIKQAMQDGTGLLVMFGDNTDPQSFNLHLHDIGEGPMPMRLLQPAGFQPGSREHFVSVINKPDHPVFADLQQDIYKEAFQQTPIFRFISTRMDPQPADIDESQVLARIRDPELSPLLIASTHGAGKALFLMSAVSRRPNRWNRLEWIGIALPFFHQAVNWLALPAADPFNLLVGAPLASTLRKKPSDIAVLIPERAGSKKILIGEESKVLAGGRHTLPIFRDTMFAGIYSIEMILDDDGAKQRQVLPFAVNPDPVEGDLSYFTHTEIRERLGVERVVRTLPTEGEVAIDANIGDLGIPLLYLALALLIGEAIMARFVSRRRS